MGSLIRTNNLVDETGNPTIKLNPDAGGTWDKRPLVLSHTGTLRIHDQEGSVNSPLTCTFASEPDKAAPVGIPKTRLAWDRVAQSA